MGKLQERIDELQRDLDLLAGIEDKARARLSGQDEEWTREVERTNDKMWNLIVAYKPDDSAHKAVHIIGQLQADAEKMRAPKRIVTDIDNKRKMMNLLTDQARKEREHKNAARRSYEEYREATT